MQRQLTAALSLVALGLAMSTVLWLARADRAEAHCQVPCGIYDDPMRIAMLHEDTTTIGKAVAQIRELSGKQDAQAFNQLVRWISTKEDHAAHIIEVVTEYFLAQKVKPVAAGAEGYEAYVKSLADHHAVMVAAMKTKQTVDESAVDALHKAIDALAVHYRK